MPHTRKKRKKQFIKSHPKKYEPIIKEKGNPKSIASCIIMAINDGYITVEQFDEIYEIVKSNFK